MPRTRLPRLIKSYTTKAKQTKEDNRRDFWMCETGTGQQVAQVLDSYIIIITIVWLYSRIRAWTPLYGVS
jgi:hypothetical protein